MNLPFKNILNISYLNDWYYHLVISIQRSIECEEGYNCFRKINAKICHLFSNYREYCFSMKYISKDRATD